MYKIKISILNYIQINFNICFVNIFLFHRSLSFNYLNSPNKIPIRYNQEIILQHSATKLISSIFIIRKIEGKTRVILEEDRKINSYRKKKNSLQKYINQGYIGINVTYFNYH